MNNSFVLNLAHNEQDLTVNGVTSKQKGEFIVKGYAIQNTPLDGEETPENYTIVLEIPEEMFRYTANALGAVEYNIELTVEYDAITAGDRVNLIFAKGGTPKGGTPK